MAVLAYNRIGMFQMCQKYGDAIIRVGCDDVLLKPGTKWREPMSCGDSKRPGEWKVDKPEAAWVQGSTRCCERAPFITPEGVATATLEKDLDNDMFRAIQHRVICQHGPAGFGNQRNGIG